MRNLCSTLSKPSILLIATALLLAFFLFAYPAMGSMFAAHTPAGGAFDTVFYYTPAEAVSKASLFGAADGEAMIRGHWTYDLAFPLSYGLFCASAWAFGLRLLAGRSRAPRFGLVAVPLAAVFFDICENASVSALLAAYPVGPGAQGLIVRLAAVAASASTPLKWLFVVPAFAGALALPIAGLAAAALKKRASP